MTLTLFPRWTEGNPVEPADVENALEKWFGRHVVLMESGRAGVRAWMRAKGLHRHRDKVLVPPYMSSCVLDTLGLYAFPVLDGKAAMMLLYHQYGLEQATFWYSGAVLEDIAHGFFIRPTHDAIFSLPKFFGIPGPAGGIVTEDRGTADRIRNMRDAEQAGAKPVDLAGFPVDTIYDVQGSRVMICRKMNAMVGSNISSEPFAFPYFGEDLEAKVRALCEAGISVNVYRVDINRDMMNPDYRRCILLPCHQDLNDGHLDIIERVLRRDE